MNSSSFLLENKANSAPNWGWGLGLSLAILLYVISAEISCSLITEVSGTDNKVKTSNNYEFLSFDNRRSKDGGEQCSTWSFYGYEAFEFLAMEILAIFLIVKGLKKLCGKGGYLEKRKESKLKRDAAKFEKLKSRFENNVEKDKVNVKGHVPDNCKEPVRDADAVVIKQLPPFVL